MARYIDADESLRMMRNSRQDCPYTATKKLIWNLAHDSCTSCIMATETADVVEVKHAHWIEKEELYGNVYYTCSNCNNDWTTIDGTPQENFMNYCPNCGAKMDGERRDT